MKNSFCSSKEKMNCAKVSVQNKVNWAITGKTAAEIIHQRADNKKDNMGLTN